MPRLDVDEVLMPGQVEALRVRIGLLAPTHKRLSDRLASTTKQATALQRAGADKAGLEVTRLERQAGRIKAELAVVNAEMETLRSLVEARLAKASVRR